MPTKKKVIKSAKGGSASGGKATKKLIKSQPKKPVAKTKVASKAKPKAVAAKRPISLQRLFLLSQ